jgi:hypothetical protein
MNDVIYLFSHNYRWWYNSIRRPRVPLDNLTDCVQASAGPLEIDDLFGAPSCVVRTRR